MKKMLCKFIVAAIFISLVFPCVVFSDEEFQTYDDYEKCVSGIKEKIAKNPNAKAVDKLYYEVARLRLEELDMLARENDIKSVRLYMQVSEKYFDEALEYLDKAARVTKSDELTLDINVLKFLIFKDRFQSERVEALFNEVANKIVGFSRDPAVSKQQLDRIAGEFEKKELSDYALRLKVLYASKTDAKAAGSVAEDIKRKADNLFKEGNLKKAHATYQHYIMIGRRIFEKDIMAARLVEIADKYFDRKKYREAMGYYQTYLREYTDFRAADYCAYRIAQCLYFDKRYQEAILQFDSFLAAYPWSKWFDSGFEHLSRLYYEDSSRKQGIQGLRRLMKKYHTKEIRDYAQLLVGLLYYGGEDYDSALKEFKKIIDESPHSSYAYAANILVEDVETIKKDKPASFSCASTEDAYKRWNPYSPISGRITPVGIDYTEKDKETICLTVKPGERVVFTAGNLSDVDRFSEFAQDTSDVSRLPREVRSEMEKDLILPKWQADDGEFLEGKEPTERAWVAPEKPGTYTVSLEVDDLGLSRPPDEGTRKDPAPKNLNVIVTVKK